MYLVNDSTVLLIFTLLINIEKVSISICSNEILEKFSYWNHSSILTSFHFGNLLSMIFGNQILKYVQNKEFCSSLFILAWSLLNILLTFTRDLNVINLINMVMGLFQGILICSTMNSFQSQIEKNKRVYFIFLIGAEMIGQSLSFVMYSFFFWKNIFLTIGIIGIVVGIVNLKFRANILHTSVLFQENKLQNSDGEMINLRLVKDFLFYLPLWAIFIAQSSTSWCLLNAIYWIPLYMKNYMHSTQLFISKLAFGPLFFIIVTIFRIFIYDYLSKYLSYHRIKQITTVISLILSAGVIGIFIFLPSTMDTYLLICFMIGVCALNLNGTYLEHQENLSAGTSLVTFLLSNSICSISGIVNSFLNAFLITESHYRFVPILFLAALINVVGAIVYFVESSILNSRTQSEHVQFLSPNKSSINDSPMNLTTSESPNEKFIFP